MPSFIKYLDDIEAARKSNDHDKAWSLANGAVINLSDSFEKTMMSYQMSLIARKEKRYVYALALMGRVTAGLGRLGGITHEKHARFLLKKIGHEDALADYLNLCSDNPSEIIEKITLWAKHDRREA